MAHYENDSIIELGGDINVGIRYDNLLAKIATYIYVTASSETTTCAWTIYFDEIEKAFGLEDGFIDEEVADDIDGTLYRYFNEFIAETEIYFERGDAEHECDRYFDVTLYTNFCVGILEDDCSVEYSLQEAQS